MSSALECPQEETRSIVSLDTSQMVCNKISHQNHKNKTSAKGDNLLVLFYIDLFLSFTACLAIFF